MRRDLKVFQPQHAYKNDNHEIQWDKKHSVPKKSRDEDADDDDEEDEEEKGNVKSKNMHDHKNSYDSTEDNERPKWVKGKQKKKGHDCHCPSFFGPEPISFACCCRTTKTSRLRRTSFSTKIMYLFFLTFIIIYSCFFIIPYPGSLEYPEGQVSGFWPCIVHKGGNNSKWGNLPYIKFSGYFGDCRGHAGYFMVYRIFLPAIIIFVILALITIGARNNQGCCFRAGIHQGFWCCKLLFLMGMSMVFFFTITVANDILFDEIFMYLGLLGSFFFSFPMLVFILDFTEVVIIKMKAYWNNPKMDRVRWQTPYYILMFFVYLFGLTVLGLLCTFYTTRKTANLDQFGDPTNYGGSSVCWANIALILWCIGVLAIVIATAVVNHLRKRKYYPHQGFLHAGVVFCHTACCVYLALGNSTDVECRPVFYPFHESKYNFDTTFTAEGFVYAIFAWLTLIYFTLANGPRTYSAPLSYFYLYVCCKPTKNEIFGVDKNRDNDEFHLDSGQQSSNMLNKKLKKNKQPPPPPSQSDSEKESSSKQIPNPQVTSKEKEGINRKQSLRKKSQETSKKMNNEQKEEDIQLQSQNKKKKSSAGSKDNKNTLNVDVKELHLRDELKEREEGEGNVYPDGDGDDGTNGPWNDEANTIKYSWSLFHFFLLLASFSIMMGITNFIRPRADGPNAANTPAYIVKFIQSPFAVLLFVLPILLPSKSTVSPGQEETEDETDEEKSHTETGQKLQEAPTVASIESETNKDQAGKSTEIKKREGISDSKVTLDNESQKSQTGHHHNAPKLHGHSQDKLK